MTTPSGAPQGPSQPPAGAWSQQPQPQPQPTAPAPAPARGRRSGPLLLGVVLGVVLAVLVGGVLVWTSVLRFGDKAAAVDTRAIPMPDSIGGYNTQLAEVKARGATATVIANQQGRIERAQRLTAESYSAAFGGAGVGVQMYADSDLQFLTSVIAVRADSPGLINGVISDPADDGLAVSMSEVYRSGDVECLVFRGTAVPTGQTASDDDLRTTQCRRSSATLTVWVVGGTATGADGRTKMVALTDAAFESLSTV